MCVVQGAAIPEVASQTVDKLKFVGHQENSCAKFNINKFQIFFNVKRSSFMSDEL